MTYHDKIFLLLSSGFVLSPSLPFSSEPQWAGALLKLPGRMVLHYQTQRLIVNLLFSSITSPLSGVLNKNDSNTSTHNDPLLTSIQSSADSTTHQTHAHTHIHRPWWTRAPNTQQRCFTTQLVREKAGQSLWGRKKEEEMIERTKEKEQMKERESETKEQRT